MTVRDLMPKGTKSGYRLADEAIAALRAGDTQALIDFHRRTFRGVTMKDDDDDDDQGGNDSGDNSNDADDSGDGDDDGDNDDDSSGDDSGDTVTKAELDAALKRMKAADQRATKAENELKKINDAKKGDLEKATERVAELETTIGTLTEQLQSERLNNAFLSANKLTWHKPATALKLAQSEGYLEDVVDEDGKVDEKALSSALAKLAKEHEYLVKPREGAGSSGEPAGGRSGNSKDDKATKAADRRRAPALARRR